MRIQRLFTANRGEIAVRVIIRAAHKLGIHTTLGHSKADTRSLAVKMVDKNIEIDLSPAAKSYLNQDVVCQAAIDTKADTIHPSYGFLAGNAEFVRKVIQVGMRFVDLSALHRLKRALTETDIEGITTILDLHKSLVNESDVIGDKSHTNYLEEWLGSWRNSKTKT